MKKLDDVDLRYLGNLEERVRSNALRTAEGLREVADQIERDVKRTEDVLHIPYIVQHALIWGMANSGADNLSDAVADYVRARRYAETGETDA